MGHSTIAERLRDHWRDFASARPGTRFQRLHRSRDRHARGSARRIVILVTGIVLMVGGMVLLPAPGPGSLVIALGAVLAARESACVARLLDRCEMHGRRLAAAARRWWRQASIISRLGCGAALLLGLCVLGFAAYEGWQAWSR